MSGTLLPFRSRALIAVRSQLRAAAVTAAVLGLYVALTWWARPPDDDPESFADLAEGAATMLAFVLPLLYSGLCRELADGGAGLWLQKPVDPVRFYLARFGEAAAVVVGLTWLAFLCVGVASRTIPPPDAALYPVVVLSVGFGMSGWMPRAGRVATVVFTVLSLVLFLRDVVSILDRGVPSLELPPPGWHTYLFLPMRQFGVLSDALPQASPMGVPASLAWILGYSAVWIALGALGVRHHSRGRLARLQGE